MAELFCIHDRSENESCPECVAMDGPVCDHGASLEFQCAPCLAAARAETWKTCEERAMSVIDKRLELYSSQIGSGHYDKLPEFVNMLKKLRSECDRIAADLRSSFAIGIKLERAKHGENT